MMKCERKVYNVSNKDTQFLELLQERCLSRMTIKLHQSAFGYQSDR